MCAVRFGLGWAHDVFKFACHMFMHTYLHFFIFLYIDLFGAFLRVSLSPSLSFFRLVASWHLNKNPLRPKTLFVLGHLLPLILLLLMYSFVMIKPERTFRRTFLNETFIQNAKSSYWIFLILTFPLSSTVGVGSHCVASRSCALPWSYRSFAPICMDLITLYPSLSFAFGVYAL